MGGRSAVQSTGDLKSAMPSWGVGSPVSVEVSKPANLEGLFGAQLQTKDGMKATSDVLSGRRAVLVYFSAHWCPPCRGFTPVLSKAYSAYDQGDVEVVFVSSD